MRDPNRRIAQRRILTVVRSVRRRWRTRIFLRGLTWIAAITGAVLFVSALSLEQMRFSAPSVIWLRILTWGTLVATTYWFILRHLFRRVSSEQVGLYLEEHEPSLEHSVVTALEAPNEAFSPALGDHLVQNALTRARKIKGGRRVEQAALYRLTGVVTSITILGLSLVLLGPSHLRLGLAALLLPTRAAAAVNPYEVNIQPGDTTIARGSDQLVIARLAGFESNDVSIFTRKGPDPTFQRLTMLSTESGDFEALLLGVDDPTEYFVEAAGIRSETFSIDVADLPYVDQLDLTYYFPRYTGLEPRTREDGGDIAALPGTLVEIRIHPTMVTSGGQFLLDGGPGQDLSLEEDGTFLARLTVHEEDFYSIHLARENGDLVSASPEYRIDLLTDQEPSVHFSKPGRDVSASPIEEVYLEVSANDDYGIGDVRIVYSVNGEREDTVPLFQESGAPLPEVSTGHTLFLEEWELEPGDLIAYYALVRDNRTISGTRSVASDMFFLNVRPLERAYRQGEESGGQQQGGGQTPETALSELQRQIISATFNLIRQRESYDPEEFSENVVSVSLSQGRLKEQIGTLLKRMQNRGLTSTDPGFRDVSSILPKAVEAMTNAQEDLNTEQLREAIPDEQIALRYVQQAEETYERYVTQQQQQPGGGGGSQAAAEDLADLFELELDKLKNQYETVQRGAQRQADNQLDELLEKLKELSQRQEQQAERQRRRAQVSPQGASSGGGTAQRELAEQTEEAARELLRLARENNDQQLEETAQQLQQAAEAMRQSASQSGSTSTTEAQTALRRLEETRRQLEEARSDRARRDAQTAINQVAELQEQQRDVQRQVRELPTSGEERATAIEQLRERKNQMTDAVSELERELDRSASSSSADNPEAARALQDGANHIRESKLKEKLQYSRGTIEQWDPQSAVTLELTIEADLQALRDELEQAADAASQRESNPLEEALEEARDLVRGMEAMERRLNEPGQQGQGRQGGQQRDQSGVAAAGAGRAEGQVDYSGRSSEPSSRTRGNSHPLSPEEIRQLQREFSQRENQVRALREQLREAGRPEQELRSVLDAIEQFQREKIYADPSQVAQLHQAILDQLKRLEFGLRRDVEGVAGRSTILTGSDEVPDGYRELVEEYYRALARGGAERH